MMKSGVRIAIALTVLATFTSVAGAQSWTTITNTFPGNNGAGVMMQLRDGRVLVSDFAGSNWFVLTPDAKGNYVNGTWSSGGSTAAFSYAPLYFGSQVLIDGHTVVVEGGEYDCFSGSCNAVWQNHGARLTYSGSSFNWVPNSPPAGWAQIGDAQSVLLPDGSYMQASCCSPQTGSAIYTGPNTWGSTIFSVGFANDEGQYTLLPNGKLLMVDAWATGCSATGSTELFDSTTKTWSCGPNTPVQLWDNAGHELGPAVLMHNGKVLQVGATNFTSVYNAATNSWASGPTPPGGLTGYDAPGALEPNGKVLLMLGPPGFVASCQFMEYDPSSNSLANTSNGAICPGNGTWYDYLMVLPSGQIMATVADFPTYVYTPAAGISANAVPTILASSTHLKSGSVNNILYGKQLNGLTQNNAFGDDEQSDTNFPLVRLTCVSGNCPAGNVYWALTHDESTHSIAPGTIMYTKFDLPAVPNGIYKLNSVANGIMSNTVTVSVP
jgi:hypothetical protein